MDCSLCWGNRHFRMTLKGDKAACCGTIISPWSERFIHTLHSHLHSYTISNACISFHRHVTYGLLQVFFSFNEKVTLLINTWRKKCSKTFKVSFLTFFIFKKISFFLFSIFNFVLFCLFHLFIFPYGGGVLFFVSLYFDIVGVRQKAGVPRGGGCIFFSFSSLFQCCVDRNFFSVSRVIW